MKLVLETVASVSQYPRLETMLNFDEFRAANDREKAQRLLETEAQAAAGNGGKKKAKENDSANRAAGNASDERSKRGVSLADILEMHQLQSFVMVLILIDTFCSFGEICVRSMGTTDDQSTFIPNVPQIIQANQYVVIAILKSINGFCLSSFAIELLLTMLVFRLSIIGHIGYLVDIMVVMAQLYLELEGAGRETRLLNVFRVWRLVRLFNTFVGMEAESHNVTKQQLAVASNEQVELRATITRLQLDVEKEKESKNAVESMLQGYKEEVDTLNEALRIAAMDIADVAQADDDLLESDDEENDQLTASEIDASSQHDKAADILSIVEGSAASLPSSATIYVNEDGSYQRK
jgi:hypothetical protein